MKTILSLICLTLVSCSTPEQNTRLSSIINLALDVAVRRGALTVEDARDVREAKTIVLEPATVETTSGK